MQIANALQKLFKVSGFDNAGQNNHLTGQTN